MYGFEGERHHSRSESAHQLSEFSYSDVPWSEVQRLTARARSERSACFAQQIGRIAATVASVFHGPGHILPRNPGHHQSI